LAAFAREATFFWLCPDCRHQRLDAHDGLANQLTSRGFKLKRGDIVIPGGISKLLRPQGRRLYNRDIHASWLGYNQSCVVTSAIPRIWSGLGYS
jgi:hypothetical protein